VFGAVPAEVVGFMRSWDINAASIVEQMARVSKRSIGRLRSTWMQVRSVSALTLNVSLGLLTSNSFRLVQLPIAAGLVIGRERAV
jgi:hypothetical protein